MFPPPSNWQNSKKHHLPNRVSNNLFELIFDESKKASGVTTSDDIIMEMGEVEEDNEIYDDGCDKEHNETVIVHRSIKTVENE